MRYLYKLSTLQEYNYSNLFENIEMISYSFLSFLVPLFIGHPQLAVGIIVNTFLITAALNLRGYKLLPIILLPSLGVLSRGIIFGPYSIYLLYFIPFIWIGNSLMVFAFKYFKLQKKYNYYVTLGIGTAMKSGFLFLSAVVLYQLGIVPVVFLTAMGALQAVTALGGGVAAHGLHYSKKYVTKA